MMWVDRRVLVTGAAGFVGSWLVRDLVDGGASVVALVRDLDPQSELVRSGDIRRVSVVNGALQDPAALERALVSHDIDTVFHLGAQPLVHAARRSPLETFESNVRGTWNVLEACRRHADLVRSVVVASSDKAYGDQPVLPYTEDMPLNGREPYEWSKSCVDRAATMYARVYGLPVAVARCGNVFGGGDLHWSRLVPGTIRSLLRGERPVIRSNGRFVRDYIYVRDVVHAYLTLGSRAPDAGVRGEAFNFGLEQPVAVLELVDAIARHAGSGPVPDIRDEAVGELRRQYLSSEKARRVLGWRPRYDLDTALAETVGWYRTFLRDASAAVVS